MPKIINTTDIVKRVPELAGIQKRIFIAEFRAAEDEEGIYNLSFSSEYPVERYRFIEILDHKPSSVRLDRLNATGSVLINHDPDKLVGGVVKAYLQDDKGRAKVRFSPSAYAQEKRQEVDAGFWRNVSVSYQIHKVVLESEIEGVETYRIVDWEPLEISLVSIPADPDVGVGRNIKIIKTEERKMDKCQRCGADLVNGECPKCSREQAIENARTQGGEKEAVRVKAILTLVRNAENQAFRDVADRYIENGLSVEEFSRALAELKRLDPKPVINTDPTVGMSGREIKRYSLVRAIHSMAENQKLDGLEKEASDATAKICRQVPKGFFIPQDVMAGSFSLNPELQRAIQLQRALSSMTSGSGGYLIDTQHMPDNLIELLRNMPYVARLGARTLSGLVGNIAIPRVTGGATAYWLSETGTVTATDQAFGQLGLVPHRLVGDTSYSKELMIQASIDVEAFVRQDLMTVLAIEKDRAAINGLGANGEPLGIMNNTGIGSVTFSGAATWAKVVDFETQIATGNALAGNIGYMTTPAVRGKWKTIPKVSGYPIFLWEKGNGEFGEVNGYNACATVQVPSNKVICGNWSDLILAEWAGIDVVVDPYTLKKQGQIEVTITLWADIGVRHAVSFTVSTDSGAQ